MSKRGFEAHEDWVAETFSLRNTITSGNKFYDPGDCVTADPDSRFPLFVDAKYTEKHSQSVRVRDLHYYQSIAAELGKRMVVALRFWHKDAVGPSDYVVLSAHDFLELLDMVQSKDRGLWCPVHRDFHPSPVCEPS